jgi:hypothetical protein
VIPQSLKWWNFSWEDTADVEMVEILREGIAGVEIVDVL